jgi:hypothetical protein
MIQSTYNRGFVLKFKNKFSISVQYGVREGMHGSLEHPIVESNVASITIFTPDEKAVIMDNQITLEFQDANAVADWIHATATATKYIDIVNHHSPQEEEAWE